MKCLLAPSVLSFPFGELAAPVSKVMAAGADWIHFDIMDGQFVPHITFGDGMIQSLRGLGSTPFEAHLMTLTPERHFESFAKAGCKRIIFHAEATHHAHRLAQALHSEGIEAGIAINPGTPASVVEPLLGLVDLVLIMTVNPGWGGQSFIETCLDKVRRIRSLDAGVDIELDGGIDPLTLPLARKAGANIFVVGSWLARQAPLEDGMKELRTLCK